MRLHPHRAGRPHLDEGPFEAWARRFHSHLREKVTDADFTFVAIDDERPAEAGAAGKMTRLSELTEGSGGSAATTPIRTTRAAAASRVGAVAKPAKAANRRCRTAISASSRTMPAARDRGRSWRGLWRRGGWERATGRTPATRGGIVVEGQQAPMPVGAGTGIDVFLDVGRADRHAGEYMRQVAVDRARLSVRTRGHFVRSAINDGGGRLALQRPDLDRHLTREGSPAHDMGADRRGALAGRV